MLVFDDISRAVPLKKHEGDIGLEIETEGLVPYLVPKMDYWGGTADPSLRGPMPWEYILKKPLSFEKQIPEALKEFKGKTENFRFDHESFTTSNHVHLNMLNDNYATMGSFFTTYALTENLLAAYAGGPRISNLFCLTLSDAEENYHHILQVIDRMKDRKMYNIKLGKDICKYAGLNLSSILAHGSLEVRFFRGTTDIVQIERWTGILHSILKYARGNTPDRVIADLKKKGVKRFLDDIFGAYRKWFFFIKEEELVMKNLWYAINIAIRVPDWGKIDEPLKVKPHGKDPWVLDRIANYYYGTPYIMLNVDDQAGLINRFDEHKRNIAEQAGPKYFDKEWNDAEAARLEAARNAPAKPKKLVAQQGVQYIPAVDPAPPAAPQGGFVGNNLDPWGHPKIRKVVKKPVAAPVQVELQRAVDQMQEQMLRNQPAFREEEQQLAQAAAKRLEINKKFRDRVAAAAAGRGQV